MPSGRTVPLDTVPGVAPSWSNLWSKLVGVGGAHPESVAPAIPTAAMASTVALTLLPLATAILPYRYVNRNTAAAITQVH